MLGLGNEGGGSGSSSRATPESSASSLKPATIASSQHTPLPQRRAQSILRLSDSKQHFHYEAVEIGPVSVELISMGTGTSAGEPHSLVCELSIESNGREWVIRRTLKELADFDCQLHRCVFDRRHSRLTELSMLLLPNASPFSSSSSPTTTASLSSTTASPSFLSMNRALSTKDIRSEVDAYARRLSKLTGSLIKCFPVLKFLELNHRGDHFVPIECSTSINTPAIAAALVVRDFSSSAPDHLSIQKGDIVAVVEMHPPTAAMVGEEAPMWKGKLTITAVANKHPGNMIGYFPSTCVELFAPVTTALPLPPAPPSQKPSIPRLHRWSSERRRAPNFIRSLFNLATPNNEGEAPSINPNSKAVFGVPLEHHLKVTGREIPAILEQCVEVIERYGIVNGIYRQCGIHSNIHRLRWEFDCGRSPDLTDPTILRDIHCVSSLLKQYLRELPNPLFQYEVYPDLIAAYRTPKRDDRLPMFQSAVRRLSADHFRTAKFLMLHLSRLARHHKHITDMNSSNLSIVWAVNILRCPPSSFSSSSSSGPNNDSHLLVGLDLHKSICTFLILHAQAIFGGDGGVENDRGESSGDGVSDGEEDAEFKEYLAHRRREGGSGGGGGNRRCIDVNGGAATLPADYHTILMNGKTAPPQHDSFASWRHFIYTRTSAAPAPNKKEGGGSFASRLLWRNHRGGDARTAKAAKSNRSQSIAESLRDGVKVHRSGSVFSYFGRGAGALRQSVMRRMRRGESSKKESKAPTQQPPRPDDSKRVTYSASTLSPHHNHNYLSAPFPYMDVSEAGELPDDLEEPSAASNREDDGHVQKRDSKEIYKQRQLGRAHLHYKGGGGDETATANNNHPEVRVDSPSVTDLSSSLESLPLDVSRYENVGPQAVAMNNMLRVKKHPQRVARPLSSPVSLSAHSISNGTEPPQPQLGSIHEREIYYF